MLTAKVDALAQGMAQLRDIPVHFAELRGYIDMSFEKTQTALKADVSRLERKLDQFIDSELRR